MDLRQFARVLWRFRILMAFGTVLALALATLAFVRVEFQGGHLQATYRKPEIWQSQTTLLLTQQGFPYGEASQAYTSPGAHGAPPVPIGDTTRLATLASLYAQLANSDAVRRSVLGTSESANTTVTVRASAVVPTPGEPGPQLPLMSITAIALSPRSAMQLAERATIAFQRYLKTAQTDARISANERVIVQVLNGAEQATLLQPRKKTLPVVVFLLVLMLVIGLAFGLENLRPQLRVREPVHGTPAPMPGEL